MDNYSKAVCYIEKNEIENLKKILEEDEKILNYGDNLLDVAIKEDRVDIVEFLLDKGIDVNCKSLSYWTPLFKAVLNNKFEIVKLLIDRGADVNVKDNSDWTPLYLAVTDEHLNVVKILLDHDADPNIKDIDGYTPLHNAVKRKNEEMIKLLTIYGADLFVKDKNGKSVLDYIKNQKFKNELLFIYHNRNRILNELIKKQKGVTHE